MLHDSRDQIIRCWLIKSELKISLGACVGRRGLDEFVVTFNRRENADMVLEGGQVDQDAALAEGRHTVADDLFGVWPASRTVLRISQRIGFAAGAAAAI